ncbi:hypothetical protein ACP275_14G278300 [Erythranthe tilingii]
MVKQSVPGRNVRGKSLKVKHALHILVLAAICIWFLYQVKQSSYYNKIRPQQLLVSDNGEIYEQHQVSKMGRKHLKPKLEKVDVEFEKQGEEELEIEDEEAKVKGIDGEENIDREEEKSEEAEHDQLQDFIDEDDKD